MFSCLFLNEGITRQPAFQWDGPAVEFVPIRGLVRPGGQMIDLSDGMFLLILSFCVSIAPAQPHGAISPTRPEPDDRLFSRETAAFPPGARDVPLSVDGVFSRGPLRILH